MGGLHSQTQEQATRGTRQPRPLARGTLVRVVVTRLPGRSQLPEVLWLWWHATGAPDLDLLWRTYVRRFDGEHTFRFVKQTLNWTGPRLRTPEQADRWTWLVLLAYTHLRLARPVVADQRLPWERRYPVGQLTPYRVRQAFWSLLGGWVRPRARQNPAAARPAGPKAAGPSPPHAIQRSKRPPSGKSTSEIALHTGVARLSRAGSWLKHKLSRFRLAC